MAIAKMFVNGDAEKMKGAEEVADICGVITDPDRCEMGLKLGGCLKAEGMKRHEQMGV